MLRTTYYLPSCSSPSSFDVSLWVMLPNLSALLVHCWCLSSGSASTTPCPEQQWSLMLRTCAAENKRITLWVLCGCDALGSSWCSIWFVTMQSHGSVFGLQTTVRWYRLHLWTNNFLTLYYFCLNVKPSVSPGWMTAYCFHTILLISQDCYELRALLPDMPVVSPSPSPAYCMLI